jgi:hypothetical protein
MITHESRKSAKESSIVVDFKVLSAILLERQDWSNAKLGYSYRSHFGRDMNPVFLEYFTEASYTSQRPSALY